MLTFFWLKYFLTDTMDNWDEQKLQEVVQKKHNEENTGKPKTDKVRGEGSDTGQGPEDY